MDAVNFLKTKTRMCNSYNSCTQCPLSADNNNTDKGCDLFLVEDSEDAVKFVEKWYDENKPKTNLDNVIEKLTAIGYHCDRITLKNSCPPKKSTFFCRQLNGIENFLKCDKNCSECIKWWEEEAK